MSNFLMITAGSLGLLIALVHGYMGETKVVGPVQEIPASAKRIMQAIMFLSAVYWFLGAALLVASPFLLTREQQIIAALAVGTLFLSGAIGNFWATKGKHFGWMLLTLATLLSWASAWAAF